MSRDPQPDDEGQPGRLERLSESAPEILAVLVQLAGVGLLIVGAGMTFGAVPTMMGAGVAMVLGVELRSLLRRRGDR